MGGGAQGARSVSRADADTAGRAGKERGSQSSGTRLPSITINDIPPDLIALIATLAQAGKLSEYLSEQGYEFPVRALPSTSTAGEQPKGAKQPSPIPAAASQQTSHSHGLSSVSELGLSRPRSVVDPNLDETARELLSALTPNTAGNSGDPYNTTVFVGGLSALIAEDTLRSFFAPFGEIHYVSSIICGRQDVRRLTQRFIR